MPASVDELHRVYPVDTDARDLPDIRRGGQHYVPFAGVRLADPHPPVQPGYHVTYRPVTCESVQALGRMGTPRRNHQVVEEPVAAAAPCPFWDRTCPECGARAFEACHRSAVPAYPDAG